MYIYIILYCYIILYYIILCYVILYYIILYIYTYTYYIYTYMYINESCYIFQFWVWPFQALQLKGGVLGALGFRV